MPWQNIRPFSCIRLGVKPRNRPSRSSDSWPDIWPNTQYVYDRILYRISGRISDRYQLSSRIFNRISDRIFYRISGQISDRTPHVQYPSDIWLDIRYQTGSLTINPYPACYRTGYLVGYPVFDKILARYLFCGRILYPVSGLIPGTDIRKSLYQVNYPLPNPIHRYIHSGADISCVDRPRRTNTIFWNILYCLTVLVLACILKESQVLMICKDRK